LRQTEFEKSAGAVIFRDATSGIMFLLLHYPAGHWDFVKGKIELNEMPRQTVLREAKEETGLDDLEFIDGFNESIEYDFRYNGKSIHKKVLFFLAKTKIKKIKISFEHKNFQWLNFEKALEKATYDNAKKVLIKANRLLSQSL